MFVSAMYPLVIVVAIFHIRKINGMEDTDIENILGQLDKESFSVHRSPLDQSIEQAKNTEYQQLVENIARSPQVQKGYPYKDFNVIVKNDPRNKHNQYRHWPWRQYIYVKPAWLKSVGPKKHILEYSKRENSNDLSKYSKAYLVLDPNADITETDVIDLSNIVSSVLKEPLRKSSFKDRIQNKLRYKGFVVTNNNRRRIRDSKEVYQEQDSQEREYKPKRSRGDYNGGGGRTPIPYIRHRGDIFEKE